MGAVIDWIVPQIHVKALMPHLIVFGDKAFREVIKFKLGSKNMVLDQVR